MAHPAAITTDSTGAGNGAARRTARSICPHRHQACTADRMPSETSTSAATRRNPGWTGSDSASSATPAAENARDVRIQARKVRSLASENRGSGSLPTP